MKQYRNVRGTQEKVASLEVNIDTVYIRTNIKRIENDSFTGWEYDEIQCSLREYQEALGDKTKSLDTDINDVAEIASINFQDSVAIAETLSYLVEEIEKLKLGGLA